MLIDPSGKGYKVFYPHKRVWLGRNRTVAAKRSALTFNSIEDAKKSAEFFMGWFPNDKQLKYFQIRIA